MGVSDPWVSGWVAVHCHPPSKSFLGSVHTIFRIRKMMLSSKWSSWGRLSETQEGHECGQEPRGEVLGRGVSSSLPGESTPETLWGSRWEAGWVRILLVSVLSSVFILLQLKISLLCLCRKSHSTEWEEWIFKNCLFSFHWLSEEKHMLTSHLYNPKNLYTSWIFTTNKFASTFAYRANTTVVAGGIKYLLILWPFSWDFKGQESNYVKNTTLFSNLLIHFNKYFWLIKRFCFYFLINIWVHLGKIIKQYKGMYG